MNSEQKAREIYGVLRSNMTNTSLLVFSNVVRGLVFLSALGVAKCGCGV